MINLITEIKRVLVVILKHENHLRIKMSFIVE